MGSYYLFNLKGILDPDYWINLCKAENDRQCRAKGLPTFEEWLDDEEPWEEFRPFTFTTTPDGEFRKTYTDNPKGGRR